MSTKTEYYSALLIRDAIVNSIAVIVADKAGKAKALMWGHVEKLTLLKASIPCSATAAASI